jgi:hypothetical protein
MQRALRQPWAQQACEAHKRESIGAANAAWQCVGSLFSESCQNVRKIDRSCTTDLAS